MSDTIEVSFKPKYFTAKKLVPLILALLVIVLDQVTKILVTKNIPLYGLGASFFDGFFRIIHVNNPGIAFSIGQGWSIAVRGVLFRAVPLIVLIVVLGVYMRNDEFSLLQRWSIAGIAGGGTFLAGALEMSNVDLTEQFTDMIVTQRGFQSNAKTIQTADTLLETVLSLKR